LVLLLGGQHADEFGLAAQHQVDSPFDGGVTVWGERDQHGPPAAQRPGDEVVPLRPRHPLGDRTGGDQRPLGDVPGAQDTMIVTGRRDLPLKEAAESIGGTALVCDAPSPDAWAAALQHLPDRIDVLVNNAGGNTDLDGAAPTDLAGIEQAWRTNLAANLLSAVLTTHAVPDRIAAGGTVVHLGSIAWQANSACVGHHQQRGQPRLHRRHTEFFRDRLTDQRRELLISQTATGRPGTPDDIAGVVRFLASPAARHVTGQVINVNGGAWPTR
jgi:3-oxoacyl-[acyl-carrier protein] reductase